MSAQQDLSAAQRARNVERMKRLEQDLGQTEKTLALSIFEAVRVHRDIRAARSLLREVFGMEPLFPAAPLYESLHARADEELTKDREEPNGD